MLCDSPHPSEGHCRLLRHPYRPVVLQSPIHHPLHHILTSTLNTKAVDASKTLANFDQTTQNHILQDIKFAYYKIVHRARMYLHVCVQFLQKGLVRVVNSVCFQMFVTYTKKWSRITVYTQVLSRMWKQLHVSAVHMFPSWGWIQNLE
jgi:hypothetical protein